jgi:hypothetical protein
MVPAFIPTDMIASPAGSTHASIVVGASEIDFESGESHSNVERSISFPMDNTEHPGLNLPIGLTPNTDKLVLVVLGIEFYQEVNGEHYSMKNGAHNAMALIKTDRVSS